VDAAVVVAEINKLTALNCIKKPLTIEEVFLFHQAIIIWPW
jgi:hypothetical protein